MPKVTQLVTDRVGLALCGPEGGLVAHPRQKRQMLGAEGLECQQRPCGLLSTVSRMWNLLTHVPVLPRHVYE